MVGVFFDVSAAKKQINKLIADGADIIDLGAESSRPGSEVVSAELEWSRLRAYIRSFGSLAGCTV